MAHIDIKVPDIGDFKEVEVIGRVGVEVAAVTFDGLCQGRQPGGAGRAGQVAAFQRLAHGIGHPVALFGHAIAPGNPIAQTRRICQTKSIKR